MGKYGYKLLAYKTEFNVNIQSAIISAINNNMFGIPFVGADACTGEGDCFLQYTVSAFMPFSRSYGRMKEWNMDPWKFN